MEENVKEINAAELASVSAKNAESELYPQFEQIEIMESEDTNIEEREKRE